METKAWDWTLPHSLRNLYVQENDPKKAGEDASRAVRFGEFGRYSVRAVHTRFDAVAFMVSDAERYDEATGLPAIIRQEPTLGAAVRGLEVAT